MTREEYRDELIAGVINDALTIKQAVEAAYKFADSHPNWIPVKRELPKKDGRYLFYDEELGPEVSSYYKGVTLMPTVTHWAPKPQPPREKEE